MKKGFTLIEVLAVVTIIGLIFVIVIPKIINSLNNKKEDIDSTTNSMIINAAKMYVDDHNTKFDKINGSTYCLPLTTLTKEKYLESPIKNVTDDKDITNIKSVKISYDNTFKYEIVNKKDCVVNLKTYKIGDKVTYNGIDFYVIADSGINQEYVTLLKAEPLTVDEVEKNAIDKNGINHVNQYKPGVPSGTAYDVDGYGGMQYYSNSTCGVNDSGSVMSRNCKTDYESSEVKYIVDNWSLNNIDSKDLKAVALSSTDKTLYSARLITYDELSLLGCQKLNCGDTSKSWIYDGEHSGQRYSYWTMTPVENEVNLVYILSKAYDDNWLSYGPYTGHNLHEMYLVRPVVNLNKKALTE